MKKPVFKINRKPVVLIMMLPFLAMLVRLGEELPLSRNGLEPIPLALIAVTLLTLYLLMRWADQDNISPQKQNQQKIDNLLRKLSDSDLDLLRERLINFEDDVDDEGYESAEAEALAKPKRQ